MSFGLYWEPVKPVKGTQLPTELKYVMARRYMGHDGSLKSETYLDSSDLSYLRGVRDATSSAEVQEGVDELIAALDVHDEVRVWIGEEDG